jgi:hypothetical protein
VREKNAIDVTDSEALNARDLITTHSVSAAADPGSTKLVHRTHAHNVMQTFATAGWGATHTPVSYHWRGACGLAKRFSAAGVTLAMRACTALKVLRLPIQART